MYLSLSSKYVPSNCPIPQLESGVCYLKKLVVLLKWVAWDVCAELRPTLLSPGVSNVAPYKLRIFARGGHFMQHLV